MIRTTFKSLTAVFILGFFIIHSAVARALISDPRNRRKFCISNNSRYAAWLIYIFGVNINVLRKSQLPKTGENRLIVCNHMSYLDVIIIQSVMPSVFVTSVEVQRTPILGILCEMAGCLFVERRNRDNIANEIDEISMVLKDGMNVVIFPEGTSSNGERILPFKVSMMDTALLGGAHILPICLKYTAIDGRKFGPENRDRVAYYGDMDFGSHFKKFLGLKSIFSEIEILDLVEVKEEENRKTLAKATYTRICEAYGQNVTLT